MTSQPLMKNSKCIIIDNYVLGKYQQKLKIIQKKKYETVKKG
jgi:hypothetical protein